MNRYIAVRPDQTMLRRFDGSLIVIPAWTRKSAKHQFRMMFPNDLFIVELQR